MESYKNCNIFNMKDRTKRNKRKEIFVHFLLLIAYEMLCSI